MSENTDRWDAQLHAGVEAMFALPEDEREDYARAFRVGMGFESRFMSYSDKPLARFWNWLIDAECTTISGIPPAVPIVLGLVLVVAVGMIVTPMIWLANQ